MADPQKPDRKQEVLDAISQLADAQATIEQLQAKPELADRLTNLAALVSRRRAGGNFNCVC